MHWERVLELADHHRVLPALFTVRGESTFPGSVQPRLSTRFEKHARKVLQFSAELAGILEKFESRGIEVLSHKGPALAQLLYGDPALRQFGDLDFLIRAADIPRARAALLELGYKQDLVLSAKQEAAYLRGSYEHVFSCNGGPHLVELQWQIVPRFYSVDFNMDALFSRSREIHFGGRTVRVLGNEDLMLVLCFHAAKHQWMHLGMVRDIAVLAQLDLDWDHIAVEARSLGVLTILSVSLLLARNLLGCRLPECLSKEAAVCQSLAQHYEARLRSGEDCDPESPRYFRSMIALRERAQDRLRFALRLALTPNVGEWQSIKLPDRVFPLYRLVRGARLLRRLRCFRPKSLPQHAADPLQAVEF